MAEILAKRTFHEGCYIELFKRNDGTHRIRYVTPQGDEIVMNLESKGWAKQLPTSTFEEIAYNDEDIHDFTGVGSKMPHYASLWRLMINMDKTILHVVQPMGLSLEKMYPTEGNVGVSAQPMAK